MATDSVATDRALQLWKSFASVPTSNSECFREQERAPTAAGKLSRDAGHCTNKAEG
jgi:hypothetical protein